MLYAIFCTDKPDRAQVRADNRQAHLEFIETYRAHVYTAGPTLSEDGQAMTGSLLIVEFDDLQGAEAFAAEDPYARSGLFESVVVRPWKQVFAPA